MNEILLNLHMHTHYSDGNATHAEIAAAALRAGLDAVVVTDHNVWVNGPEGYYQDGDKKVLLLVGEEIHDQARQPQKSHLLVIGAGRELAQQAYDPQNLIDHVSRAHGLSFLAHIVDPPAQAISQDDLSWEDWNVQGYTGIELWNGFSELKVLIKSKLHAIYYAYNFRRVAHAPLPQSLEKWDELLVAGQKVVAVSGSDAHAIPGRLGPLRRTVFPYEDHFRAINNHLLLLKPLTGELAEDRRLILEALECGRLFIGYDLPAPTRGFRFSAQGKEQTAQMGEEISARHGVTMQIRLPAQAECRLVKDGKVIKTWEKRNPIVHITTEPGAYRVEAFIDYLGKRRGWIFSNPIYVIR
jgi:hypothetical protein